MNHSSPSEIAPLALPIDRERLFGRVQLVRGKGSRRNGRLCIMAFVALLAGERHTDAPACASPLVRQFAMALNDGLSDEHRQQLKPFAPQMIGTRDARDPDRLELLRTAWRDDIAPRLRQDDVYVGSLALDDLYSHYVCGGYFDEWRERKIGTGLAMLLTSCAGGLPDSRCSWYRTKGIDLLDRLCDVGNVEGGIAEGLRQLVTARNSLQRPTMLDRIAHRMSSTVCSFQHGFRNQSPT